MTTTNRPLFKDLSDSALGDAYRGTKALAHNAAAIRSRCLGRLLRDLDIIVAVSRKRGLRLPV